LAISIGTTAPARRPSANTTTAICRAAPKRTCYRNAAARAGHRGGCRQQRRLGLNRYEIYAVLRERGGTVPSLSAIYRALVRTGLNRRTRPMQEEKRRIIKDKLGELGHIDLHRVPRDVMLDPPAGDTHVVCIIDSCSRLAWAGVVVGKKALSVMFRSLSLINTLNQRYGLIFSQMLSDNGAEFASRANPTEHPFEAMLGELGIRHRYTRPYRPQTNGKVERFWRTLEDDLIEGTTFDGIDQFADELMKYMIYYNEFRPHQALGGLTPKAFADTRSNA
jgi:transposase InsO family protein